MWAFIIFKTKIGSIALANAVLLLEATLVTAETLSGYLIDCFDQDLPSNVDGISISLKRSHRRPLLSL